jgi:hypothetical protein
VSASATVFLLSPANLSGKRGKMVLNPNAGFELGRALRSQAGAPLGEVFSFVSSLYFRGKLAYAKAFSESAADVFVITAGGGLCVPSEAVTLARLQGWQRVSVSEHNPHFTAPLQRHASQLLDERGADTRFVLLGSVASNKYVGPLLEVFDERLLFPARFTGLGDMSRGSLLLQAVRNQSELDYATVADADRRR